MKLFNCQKCDQLVFFESTSCTNCSSTLAFLPELGLMSALEPIAAAIDAVDQTAARAATWKPLAMAAKGASYRICRNGVDHQVCNWAVPEAEAHQYEYCRACRLNHMIPPIGDPHALLAWHKLEIAKRRLVYTLLSLGLPVETKLESPEHGLAFDFLQDDKSGAGPHVITGHDGGLITINIAEADAPFREQVREQLGETYRTLLGHLRHESGHYYWERLVKDTPIIDEFRTHFGDEQKDYTEAMNQHYQGGGPPSDWQTRFVSVYASMHPWEDWAETWAHYLHMVDTVDTAQAYGVSLRPRNARGAFAQDAALVSRQVDAESFSQLIEAWYPLTNAMNSLNRSMGTNDCYPFVLSDMAVQKLRFVHDVVRAQRPEKKPEGGKGDRKSAEPSATAPAAKAARAK